ncbi:MAG TPA: acyltransferase [Puia sp.]|uniref:acyltransferase family protein n=1 Tax=Puia sp. TaxID=2045100 RepID=UPI002BD4A57C|nr:acyltransferase [Puia sp.]HVU97277.1 acyltransferase [Puia sp.]
MILIFVLIITSPSIESPGKHYYPGLPGLRAIAALTVLFTHVERLRLTHKMPTWITPAFNSFIGGAAVTFFFVLSGFLITMLLLTEKAAEGTIRVRRFLVNRTLRIWPLYYLTLGAGYAISILVVKDTGSNPLSNGLLLNLLLLPNLSFVLGCLPDILVQAWSIGTEEQFYLVWPFLIRRLPVHRLILVFAAIIVGWGAARGFAWLIHSEPLGAFLFRARIDCMAIGGLAALLLFRVKTWPKLYGLILQPATGHAAAIAFIGLLWISKRYDISLYPAYGFLYAIACLRVTGIPVRWLEWRPLRYLGKISYGIYLIHQFVLYFLFHTWFFRHPMGETGMFIIGATLTIGFAALSYRYFESYFLSRKITQGPSPGPIPS